MDSQTSTENLITTITAPPPAAGEKTDELDYHKFNTPRGWEHMVYEGVGEEEMLAEVEEWLRTERAVRFWHRLVRAHNNLK